MNHSSCIAFLEFFGFVHGGDASEDEEDFSLFFPCKDASPLSRIYAFKDLGNDLFRHNQFDQASACYDNACRLLCLFMKDKSEPNIKSSSTLGISLCLNLAACAIKLKAFEGALILCSMVLNYFPRHAKALFRKAIALKSLSRFHEACSALEEAALVEPQNKDIFRELGDIKSLPVFNKNGKRMVEDSFDAKVKREGKRLSSSLEIQEASVENCPDNKCDTNACVSSLLENGKQMAVDSFEANNIRNGKRVSSLLENQEANVSRDVAKVENCTPDNIRVYEFDPLGKSRKSKKPILVSQSIDRMDLGSSSDASNETCANTNMNVDPTPCSSQNHGAQSLNFNKKGGGCSHLKIDASSYHKLIQGKEILFHQHKILTTMTVRVHKPLPRKEAQMGTLREETSWEAAVPPSCPPSSPLLQTRNLFDLVSVERAELVDEEAIFQVEKKKRVTCDSFRISKISVDQFRFAAVREHSRKSRSNNRDHFKGHSRRASDDANLKTKSLVSMEHLSFVCRYTKTVAVNQRNKRKDAKLIHFDAHYHPPFKKRQMSSSVWSFSKCSRSCWQSSSYGVSDAPQFVF